MRGINKKYDTKIKNILGMLKKSNPHKVLEKFMGKCLIYCFPKFKKKLNVIYQKMKP